MKMNKIDQIQEALDSAKANIEKFNDGNNSAGTRVRKSMQEIKGLAQEVRIDVQNKKNE